MEIVSPTCISVVTSVLIIIVFVKLLMDSTRLALIISCLIYCLMLFVSAAVYDERTKKNI